MVFLAVQVRGTDVIYVIFWTRNNRKLICIDLNDVNSGNLNSEKDSKDKVFSMKNITFRPKMY